MEVYKDIDSLRKYLKKLKKEGKSIGFVPTMGYLHKGHQSLIQKSSIDNDITVVSIFVNPTQFGPNEDFEKYPRNHERDILLSSEAGADLIFLPEVKEMYPDSYKTYVEVEDITQYLCGASRPGHFKGVTTIVTKLLNIILPDKAYFGQKDAQQAVVIKQMVLDLNIDTDVVVCPIVREDDGLAMSSRNVYLSVEERIQALGLSQALKATEELVKNGERDAAIIKESIRLFIESKPLAKIDYIEVVDSKTLMPQQTLNGGILIALAVKFGSTRLIDNILLEV